MPRSESSLVAVLLTQRLVDGPAEPLKASEYWRLAAPGGHLQRLLGLSPRELVDDFGLDEELAQRVAARLGQATQVAFAIDEAEQSGIRVITSVDVDYPTGLVERLGASAPPLLYVAGGAEVLGGGGLAIVASRDVTIETPEAAEVAKVAAERAASAGATVILGGTKGIDGLAIAAALDAGGRAVGALADSLLRVVRDPDTRRAITNGSLCLCTPYNPSLRASAATASGRNKIIHALSTATLVVASDHDKGTTWSGAIESLEHGYAPVVVWAGAGAAKANRGLVERGAIAIGDIDELFPLEQYERARTADAVVASADATAEQLTLEL